MAIQAQLYQENIGFPLFGSSQEYNYSLNNDQQKNQYLYYHHNQPQQQHQQQVFFHEFQSLNQRNDAVLPSTMVPNSFSQTTMFDHLEKTHRDEIDQYIKYQNDRLRTMVQDQRKQQLLSLMRNAEPKILGLLRDKDEEISRASKRTMELQELLRTLEAESATWQSVARESEAMVVSLNASLEQAVRERAAGLGGGSSPCFDGKNVDENNAVEDEESCCDQKRRSVSSSPPPPQLAPPLRVCESCGSRDSCMVLLPCRHFCSCKACESFLESCPVCREPKKASIEALTF